MARRYLESQNNRTLWFNFGRWREEESKIQLRHGEVIYWGTAGNSERAIETQKRSNTQWKAGLWLLTDISMHNKNVSHEREKNNLAAWGVIKRLNEWPLLNWQWHIHWSTKKRKAQKAGRATSSTPEAPMWARTMPLRCDSWKLLSDLHTHAVSCPICTIINIIKIFKQYNLKSSVRNNSNSSTRRWKQASTGLHSKFKTRL